MKNLYYKLGAGLSTLPLLLPLAAQAQLDVAQTKLQATQLGGTTELPELIGKFINVILSLLGIIFVVLIIWAGFDYLTDAGEGKKVETAKKKMINGVIGIILVVTAYAIADFVISSLKTATT